MRHALLGLALCAALVGCDKTDEGTEIKSGASSLFDPAAANPSLCGSAAIPFPNNALISGFRDPTLNIPNGTEQIATSPSNPTPFVSAANRTDGFSTTASMFTDVLGQVDYATAADAVVIVETDSDPVTAGSQPRVLQYGVDFTVQPSIALAQFSGTGHSVPTGSTATPTPTPICTGVQAALFLPISQQRSRLLIEPLKPLLPSTTYIVAVTNDLLSTDGVATSPSDFWRITNSGTTLCDRNNSNADPTILDCSAAGAPEAANARIGAPFLSTLLLAAGMNHPAGGGTPLSGASAAAARMTTLETLRATLVRPTVSSLQAIVPTLTDDRLVIAWSFTTESTRKTLDNINSTPFGVPRTLGVVATNLNTNQANSALANTANIYAGSVSLPYFLHVPADGTIDPDDFTGTGGANGPSAATPAILATFFAADATAPDVAATWPVASVPCGAFATGAALPGGTGQPSVSTTICYPRPTLRSNQTVPMLVTVPNANAPGNCGGRGTIAGSFAAGTCVAPAGGWPVVIFQHGITRNRSDMLAVAPTLASAGFVVVAIDLPLHGLVPDSGTPGQANDNGFCGATANNGFFSAAPAERTFGVDYVSNSTGAAGPDNLVDCSGTHFVNLSSLITSRDNLRQAESDIIHLAKSVNGLDFDGDGGTDEIAETELRFLGQSLGAIVGTTVMGVDVGGDDTANEADELFGAASLNVPGGGLGKLLDASASFGPRIAAGLAASGVFEGTDNYETFVRFAQHLMDPADPINYAKAANDNHVLHVTQVFNDAVVPNAADSTCPPAADLPAISATAAGFASAAETAAASGAAGAALLAQCPPLALPADAPLNAITYQDEVAITGYLSGTEALIDIMGITNVKLMGGVTGGIFTAQTNSAGDTAVKFLPDTAEHGTLLTPTASSDPTANNTTFAPATCAMQKQAATFLAGNGALAVPIGGTCP
jgi:hypothetical protein